jgi:hypothetical protein
MGKKLKVKKWRVYGAVFGTKYLGVFEAQTKEEAIEKALKSGEAHVSLCHQCAGEMSDPEIQSADAEEDVAIDV